MPATESNAKTDKRASSQTSGSAVNAAIAKKRKLTPAEALIKSMTARKAIGSQKKPSGSHVTFGDNDDVIEKKPATEKEDQKKKKKKKAKKTTSDAAGSMVSTASLFQGGSTGSILPNNPAIEYLRAWKSDPQSWKFQKVRQTWLLANIYDEIKISEDDFAILLEYLQDLKGKARQTTIEEATQIHQQYPDNDESESETDETTAADKDDDDDEFDAEKMMAKAQKHAQSVKAQEQKQEHQVAKKKARRAMELLRTLS